METPTLWWLMSGVAVLAELLTGTFYLLMLALGLAAGALAAHAGLGTLAQTLSAAAVGMGAVLACYLVRKRPAGAPSARADRSVNLDVGETRHHHPMEPRRHCHRALPRHALDGLHRPGQHPAPRSAPRGRASWAGRLLGREPPRCSPSCRPC